MTPKPEKLLAMSHAVVFAHLKPGMVAARRQWFTRFPKTADGEWALSEWIECDEQGGFTHVLPPLSVSYNLSKEDMRRKWYVLFVDPNLTPSRVNWLNL